MKETNLEKQVQVEECQAPAQQPNPVHPLNEMNGAPQEAISEKLQDEDAATIIDQLDGYQTLMMSTDEFLSRNIEEVEDAGVPESAMMLPDSISEALEKAKSSVVEGEGLSARDAIVDVQLKIMAIERVLGKVANKTNDDNVRDLANCLLKEFKIVGKELLSAKKRIPCPEEERKPVKRAIGFVNRSGIKRFKTKNGKIENGTNSLDEAEPKDGPRENNSGFEREICIPFPLGKETLLNEEEAGNVENTEGKKLEESMEFKSAGGLPISANAQQAEDKEPKQLDIQGLNLNPPVTKTLSLKQPHYKETKETDETPDKKTEEDKLKADTPEITEREKTTENVADDTPSPSADMQSVDPTDREEINDQLSKSKVQEDPVQIGTVSALKTESSPSKLRSSMCDLLTDGSGESHDGKRKLDESMILETSETTKKGKAGETVEVVVDSRKLRFNGLLDDSSDSDDEDDVRNDYDEHGSHEQSNDFQFDDYGQINNFSDDAERFDDFDPTYNDSKNFSGFDAAGSSPAPADYSFSSKNVSRNPLLEDNENNATHDSDDEAGIREGRSEHSGRDSPVESDGDDDRGRNFNHSGDEELFENSEEEEEVEKATPTQTPTKRPKGRAGNAASRKQSNGRSRSESTGPGKSKKVIEKTSDVYKLSQEHNVNYCLHSTFHPNEECNNQDNKFKWLCDATKEPDCITMPVSHETELPGANDYRGLNVLFRDYTMAVRTPEVLPDATITFDAKNYPPSMNFTGPSFMEASEVTGKDIVDQASYLYTHGQNRVYGPSVEGIEFIFEASGENENVLKEFIKKEDEYFSNVANDEMKNTWKNAKAAKRHPVPVYPQFLPHQFDKMKEVVNTAGFCMFDGVFESCNVDTKQFEVKTFSQKDPDCEIKITRQVAQKTGTNYKTHYKSEDKNPKGDRWKTEELPKFKPSTMKDFEKVYEMMVRTAKEGLEKLETEPERRAQHLNDLKKKFQVTSHSIAFDKSKVNRAAFMLFFGTNIDLMDEEKFLEAINELRKLPDFIAPEGEDNLLYTVAAIGGLNRAQLYWKTPAARTNCHLENNCLVSININIGPGSVVWFSIPPEYNHKFQKLIVEKLREPLKESESSDLYRKGYWPLEQDVLDANIPLMKCVQKPGQMVLVGAGTYHWVQSIGFAVNVAWNIAPKTFCQLAAAAVYHDHALKNMYKSLVPLEALIWDLARKNIDMDEELTKLVKVLLMKSLASCQFQLDYARIGEWKPKMINEDSDIEDVERCENCKIVLFNIIPKRCTRWTITTYCFKCIDTVKINGRLTLKNSVIVYQRYTMDQLIATIDSFGKKRNI